MSTFPHVVSTFLPLEWIVLLLVLNPCGTTKKDTGVKEKVLLWCESYGKIESY